MSRPAFVTLAGAVLTETVLVRLVSRLTEQLLASLCASHSLHGDQGDSTGFFCSTIPFARSLSALAVRGAAYATLAATQLGLDVKSVLSGVGIGGLVVGWALKQVIAEAVSGVMILVARPFSVGDRIIIRTGMMNFEGTVRGLTLHHTILSAGRGPGDDPDGPNAVPADRDILVPNSLVLKAVIRKLPRQPQLGQAAATAATAAVVAAAATGAGGGVRTAGAGAGSGIGTGLGVHRDIITAEMTPAAGRHLNEQSPPPPPPPQTPSWAQQQAQAARSSLMPSSSMPTPRSLIRSAASRPPGSSSMQARAAALMVGSPLPKAR